MTAPPRIHPLLSRASFGPRPGDPEALAGSGSEAWIERQLRPERIPDRLLEARLRDLPDLALPSGGEMLGGAPMIGPKSDPAKKIAFNRQMKRLAHAQAGQRVVRAAHTRRELHEVMVDFWWNHFNVFARKGPMPLMIPAHEAAIRKHALGRFEDLLLATARSPAMLFYLDNVRSSRKRRFGTKGGINENYARELLELHTLGVDGGYTQEDVVSTARVLSGWSIESPREPSFRYRRFFHERGPKRVLGKRVRGSGIEEGQWLLRELARHPSTARHVSTKLARRFVADEPPLELVDRVSRRWLETEGDIAQVMRTLLRSPEFMEPAHRKLKTPLELIASAIRYSGGETSGGKEILFVLYKLGEPPLHCVPPTGFPDRAADWLDPGSMLERIGFAFAFSSGRIEGTELDLVARDREKLALDLASPEFQWQ